MSYEPPPPKQDRSVGELVFEMSEQVSGLVREEIGSRRPRSPRRSRACSAAGRSGSRRHVRLPRADPADALDRLAAERPLLRRPLLDRLPDRGRAVLYRRRGRRDGRLRAVQAGATSNPDLAIEEAGGSSRRWRRGRIRRERADADPLAPSPAQPPRRRRAGVRAGEQRAEHEQRRGEPVAKPAAGGPGRTSSRIRADIERKRQELSHSVEALRGRVNELTDWRRQVRGTAASWPSVPPWSASPSAA